ncbi:MAG: SagB/ThcOx family dehydrogenase [Frankiaceae bacterium]
MAGATDQRLTEMLLYNNAYKTIDPWVRSTGLRTNALRYRTLSHSSLPGVAEEFLAGTTLRRNDWETASSVAAYFSDAHVLMLAARETEQAATAEDVLLPAPLELTVELGDALARRRSRRRYTGDPMALDYLATILRAAVGITGVAEATLKSGGTAALAFRAAPSAGGLYPIELYLVAQSIAKLRRGVYRYAPHPERLVPVGGDDVADAVLEGFAVSEEMISLGRSDVVCLLVAHPWRAMRKYGARGMRFVLMEAGSIAQNVNLAAVALGYGSVECASVYEDEVNAALGLDGAFRTLVHTVVVGYPG